MLIRFLCLNYVQGDPTVCVHALALWAVALGRDADSTREQKKPEATRTRNA